MCVVDVSDIIYSKSKMYLALPLYGHGDISKIYLYIFFQIISFVFIYGLFFQYS